MTHESIRIGVDLGGTKIEAVALDRAGDILARRRAPTPAHDYEGILRSVCVLVHEIELETNRRATVGVGTPGALSARSGVLKNANTTALNGKPFDRDLAAMLGREVRLENDANCFALSEARDGAGAGARVVFGVILGTGFGGGIVIDGKILSGRNHVAGEWGHNPLPFMTAEEYPGATCYCGRCGCIETFLAGAGLVRDYRQRSGRVATAQEIVGRAVEARETEARASLAALQERLARALAHVVNLLDPDVIVLGGGLSNIDAIYDGLESMVEARAFTDALDTKIRRNIHGDSSGVRGAAWLWGE